MLTQGCSVQSVNAAVSGSTVEWSGACGVSRNEKGYLSRHICARTSAFTSRWRDGYQRTPLDKVSVNFVPKRYPLVSPGDFTSKASPSPVPTYGASPRHDLPP